MKTANNSHSQSALQRLNRAILIGFAAIALALIYWSVARSDILEREDNPRLFEAEFRLQRGPILDRNGVVLAENGGTSARQVRLYPHPEAAAVLGYYSFRHGTAGIEESYDAWLRGEPADFWADFMRQTLHEPQVGQPVQLTLDVTLQATAVSLLNHKTGAILLLDISQPGTAEILALASAPSYDPNQLDENFDALLADASAPLLNRVTQGQYQPGLVLQPFILAAAVEQGLIRLDETVTNANRNIPINGIGIRCITTPPEPAAWTDVLRHRCPGPMQDLADLLGIAGLDEIFVSYGLSTTPQFALDTEAPNNQPLANPRLAGIGQENLTVTPLQVGLAWAALVGNGRIPTPKLIAATNQPTSQPTSQPASPILQALPQHQTITEYSRLVLSGPEGSTNGWYLGASNNFVVIVMAEESNKITEVEEIGRAIITQAINNH